MNVDELVGKYRSEFKTYNDKITSEKENALPFIINEIITLIIPSLMTDVGQIENMSGEDKKILVTDTVIKLMDITFDAIDKKLKSDIKWDNYLHATIKYTLPTIIDILIGVENGKIVFNKKPVSRFNRIKSWVKAHMCC